MIRIAICDDNEMELSRTKVMCSVYAVRNPELEIQLTTFQDPVELMDIIRNQHDAFDILLLDIYMPKLTGMELAREVHELAEQCQLIFLTTSREHAIEAFSLHAAHYLVKPFTSGQLEDALSKATAVIQKYQQRKIILKTLTGLRRIDITDIVYSETDKHIQNIYLADNERIQVRISNSEFYTILSAEPRFFKCGSTYIINLDRITEITTQHILFDNGKAIPVQRRQYRELLDRYTAYSLQVF